MTTIAWDGRALAADTRACTQAGTYLNVRSKICRTPDGRLIGMSGQSARCQAMRDWLCKPESKRGPMPEWQSDQDKFVGCIEIMPDGKMRYWMTDGAADLDAPFDAIGSGGQFAIGAMACGKTAAEAVAIAAQFDTGTGGRIDVLELRELRAPQPPRTDYAHSPSTVDRDYWAYKAGIVNRGALDAGIPAMPK